MINRWHIQTLDLYRFKGKLPKKIEKITIEVGGNNPGGVSYFGSIHQSHSVGKELK